MRHPVLAASALALCIAGAAPADAAKKRVSVPHAYDGNWSIEVVTLEGPCERAYRYGVQIHRGEAFYPGGDVNIRGRVAANGAVNGTIARGSDGAQVVGRLSKNGTGGGTWGSVGNSPISCSGRWTARKRG